MLQDDCCSCSRSSTRGLFCYIFFNDTATTEIYTYCHTLSLHDALPIYQRDLGGGEIAGERQSRLLAEAVAAQRALFGQRRHDRLGPRILPDDGVMDRPAGRAVPPHAALSPVGDSDRCQPGAADPSAGNPRLHPVTPLPPTTPPLLL